MIDDSTKQILNNFELLVKGNRDLLYISSYLYNLLTSEEVSYRVQKIFNKGQGFIFIRDPSLEDGCIRFNEFSTPIPINIENKKFKKYLMLKLFG